VLGLHTSTHGAPHAIGYEIKDAGSFLSPINANRNTRENARKILHKYCCCDDAIIAFCVAQVHFIL
jgi:hypothetical protein